jgi:hypothetical protein
MLGESERTAKEADVAYLEVISRRSPAYSD